MIVQLSEDVPQPFHKLQHSGQSRSIAGWLRTTISLA